MSDARWRTTVRASNAARIQKTHSRDVLISRDMGVAMQNDIRVVRRIVGRDMNEAKPDPISPEINDQGPLDMAIAISAHHRHWRAVTLDLMKNTGIANVAQMPDFIRVRRECFKIRRQFIMRVGEDEDAKRRGHC